MKIELNYTYDELVNLLDGLNNALISLNRNYCALSIGCEDGIPLELGELKITKNDCINRLNAVKELYEYLLTYENG